MSKRIFSSEEQQRLRENPHVARVSERSITYAPAFKERALLEYDEGLPSAEIFKRAGFDLAVIGRKQPKNCLQRWRKRFRKHGVDGLVDTRGKIQTHTRRKNTETDRLKWLEAEVAYLRKENSFLAKLRARRAE